MKKIIIMSIIIITAIINTSLYSQENLQSQNPLTKEQREEKIKNLIRSEISNGSSLEDINERLVKELDNPEWIAYSKFCDVTYKQASDEIRNNKCYYYNNDDNKSTPKCVYLKTYYDHVVKTKEKLYEKFLNSPERKAQSILAQCIGSNKEIQKVLEEEHKCQLKKLADLLK